MIQRRFYAQRTPWGRGVDLHFCEEFGDSGFAIAQPLILSKVEEGQLTPPFLTVDTHTAQTMIDALWSCGLRPSEGSGSAGSLAATERHLEDMRKLVFKKEYKIQRGDLA